MVGVLLELRIEIFEKLPRISSCVALYCAGEWCAGADIRAVFCFTMFSLHDQSLPYDESVQISRWFCSDLTLVADSLQARSFMYSLNWKYSFLLLVLLSYMERSVQLEIEHVLHPPCRSRNNYSPPISKHAYLSTRLGKTLEITCQTCADLIQYFIDMCPRPACV